MSDRPTETPHLETLVLSVDIGAGHRMAAEALVDALRQARPGSHHTMVDALEHAGPDAGRLARDLYFGSLEEAPELWGMVYDQRQAQEVFRGAGELADDVRSVALGNIVRRAKPDVIVAMHPIAVGLGASVVRVEPEVDCPLVAVVTDFDAHPLWVARGVDLYVVATKKVASGLAAHGLPSGTIEATGIPLRRGFASVRQDPAVRIRLGLDPSRFTILLLGGGLGLGPIAETARRLVSIDGPVQLVLVAGSNQELEAEARRLAASAPIPFLVEGRVEAVWDYVAAADLAVGKPGGLTCAELLAGGVPLVALSPIPGQEQANCDALVEEGAAVEASSAEAAYQSVMGLLEAPDNLERMRLAAMSLGRPGSASGAARKVVRLVDEWHSGSVPRRSETPLDTVGRAGRAVVSGLDDLARQSGLADDGIVQPIHEASRAVASGIDDLSKATGVTPKSVLGSLSRLGRAAADEMDTLAKSLGLSDDEKDKK